MRQVIIYSMLCLMAAGCATQGIRQTPCGNFDGTDIQLVNKTVVPLDQRSTDSAVSFKPAAATILLRLEDVMAALKTRVDKVGYSSEEQRMRRRLLSYPPRAGFSDLSQYSPPGDTYVAESIAMELLETGKAVVVDPRASSEGLSEVVIFSLRKTALQGRASWREVCSTAGDFILFYLDGVQP